MTEPVTLADAFARIDRLWTPHVAAELNGQHVKLAKVQGDFVWHSHADEDELFLVVKGALTIHLRDRSVTVGEGALFVVPRGVEHRPEAEEETWIVLFEPAGTAHTGDVESALTVHDLPRI